MALPDPLLWLVDAAAVGDAELAAYAIWLGPSEQARCARFVRPERRRQFIVGRALLRLALGRLLAVEPRAIALAERPGQAPALTAPAVMDGGFSISHSGRWVACAAGSASLLGLDVERTGLGRDVIALAGEAFTPAEVAQLASCAPAGRDALFHRMWCGHEARIKLGAPCAIAYPLAAPGVTGVLACSHALAAPPVLRIVRLDEL